MVDEEYIGQAFKQIGMKKAMKKPLEVEAKQMDRDFVVETLEGLMHGNRGDYLVKGIEGEYYPVKRQIFEKTYCMFEELP